MVEYLMSDSNQLLKSPIDRRSDIRSLVEVDGGFGSFADPLGSHFEFLQRINHHRQHYFSFFLLTLLLYGQQQAPRGRR